MVEPIGNDKAAGISRLSGYLARYYQPLFLHRNLQQALSYHEEQLSDGTWNERQLMTTATRSEQSWQPPDTRQLELLGSRRQPVFTIQVKSIRPQAKDYHTNGINGQKRARLARLECEIEVTIWEIRPGEKCVPLIRDATAGRLQGQQVDSVSLPDFHVTMNPLVISTSRMMCDVGEDGNWRRGLAPSYHLDICVLFRSSKDAKTYFDMAEPGRFSGDYVVPKRIRLATKWHKFPRLPKEGEPLPMHVTLGDNRNPTPYALNADMSFSMSSQSILAEHNYLMKLKAEPTLNGINHSGIQPQNSNASATNGVTVTNGTNGRAVAGGIKLGFIWSDQEAFIAVKGFCCVICDKRWRFPSHETLLQHLRNSHEHFRSEMVDASRGPFAKLNLHYVIELSLAPEFTNKKRELPLSKYERDVQRAIEWIAPKRPFDLHRHLKGDDWASVAPKQKKRHVSPIRQTSTRVPPAVPSSKAPEDVQDLPQRLRRTVTFPKIISGKTVFKLDSKRPLKQGDMVSESDDDIDPEWMKPRRDELTGRAEMSDECAKFSTKWNDYLERNENLSGDAYLGDATVRFLRRHGDELTDKVQNEFMGALLQSFHMNGVIQDSFLTFGHQQLRQKLADPQKPVQQTDSTTETFASTPSRKGRTQGQPVETTAGNDSPASQTRRSARRLASDTDSLHREAAAINGDMMDIDPPPRSSKHEAQEDSRRTVPQRSVELDTPKAADGVHCVCGQVVDSMQRIVICSNLKAGCKQPKYHMRCVNLKQRDSEWLCPLCARIA